MSDGDVGDSRDSLNDAPPDSFWEIGMFKRTVKRIEDGDRICDQMIKVHFFFNFSFLLGTKFRISRDSPKNFCISTRPKFSRDFIWARKPKSAQILVRFGPKAARIGSDSAKFSARKPEIRPNPYFVPENPNLVGFGPFSNQKYQYTNKKNLY